MSETGSSSAKRRSAAGPLFEGAGPAAERLTHLRGMFERLGAHCTDNLRQLASSPIEIGLRDLAPGGDGNALAEYGDSAPVAVFHAPDRTSRILIGADAPCMDAAIEAAFGADGSEPPSERREAWTNIEMRLAGTIFDLVADALRSCFAASPVAPMEREKLEPAARLPEAMRRGHASVLAKFGFSTLERAGEIFVLLPQAALQGLQPRPASATSPGPTAHDPRWSKRIEQEVQRTQVTLQAVLDEQDLTLSEVAEFRVGQMLALRAGPRSNIKVVCNDQTLFWCELGQAEGAYTLRVKDFPDEEQELINAIFSS